MILESKEFYKLLVRPTVVITTISSKGFSNAAPFSWNSPMAMSPIPLFGFSSNMDHDTWRNIKENGEFVVNLVGDEFGPLMEVMEKDLPYETSEIEECGLSETPAKEVRPKRIWEAFAWLECRMKNHFVLSERNVWVIGEVLNVEVKDECLNEVIDLAEAKPLNHIWGEFFVTEMHAKKFKRAN